jgi:protein-tyrosine phosphatase
MSDPSARPIRVQFVCLGNICRSPLAEALFRRHVRAAGLADRFEIASAGTGDWHVGKGADPRSAAHAEQIGVSLSDHAARQVTTDDLAYFDHVLVMDKQNLHDVLALDPDDAHSPKVRLLREFDVDPGDFSVPDPYYGGADGFADVQTIVDRSTQRLLDGLIAHYGLAEAQSE